MRTRRSLKRSVALVELARGPRAVAVRCRADVVLAESPWRVDMAGVAVSEQRAVSWRADTAGSRRGAREHSSTPSCVRSYASTTPMVWKFVCVPMAIYACERLVRVYRG